MSIADLIVDPACEDAERADEALAYVLLEEARLVCEGLRDGAPGAGDDALLAEIHADVGMGAYDASDRMDPSLRLALLDMVRERDIASVMDDAESREHLLLALPARHRGPRPGGVRAAPGSGPARRPGAGA